MKKIGVFFLLGILIILAGIIITSNSSGDEKSEPGSFKIRQISASPEYEAKYKSPNIGDPEDMAYQFLELNKEYLLIQNPRQELTLRDKFGDKLGKVVFFQQNFNGIPIDNSYITARFYPNGRFKSLEGNYLYDINLSTNYSIDSVSAGQTALQNMKSAPNPKIICPSKPIIAHSSALNCYNENRVYLVWPVQVFPDSTAAPHTKESHKFVEYYIDALDGTIIYRGENKTTRESTKGLEPIKIIQD